MSAKKITDQTDETCDEVIETGEVEEARMILGDKERVRYAGVIRAGKQVPVKSKCSPADIALYEKLDAQGIPYDDINRQMGGKPKSRESKLTMTNVDHFVIRDCDFKKPADAQYLRDKFADKDGKVRRIPVWFTAGDIPSVIPHNHAAFDGSSSIRAFTYYEGETQMIKYVPKSVGMTVKADDWIIEPFDHDNPPEKAPAVKFGGLYKVNIEGIKGAGEIVVPTGSWYGLGDAVAVLKKVRAELGRFSGLFNDKTFFELVKTQEMVKAPDGTKKKQWLVTIELSIDKIELARHSENRLARGLSAINSINGVKSAPVVADAATVVVASAVAAKQSPVSLVPPKPVDAPSDPAPVAKEAVVAPVPDPAAKVEAPVDPVPVPTPAPAKVKVEVPAPAAKADVPSTPAPAADDVVAYQAAIDDLYALAKKHDLSDLELEAYGNFKFRAPLNQVKEADRIKKLQAELKMRLEANAASVKARCQLLLKESAPVVSGNAADPQETEAMIGEFTRLAENSDLDVEHFMAHLTIFSSGQSPADMSCKELQDLYGQVAKRLSRGNLEQFRLEIAGNYREMTKKAA